MDHTDAKERKNRYNLLRENLGEKFEHWGEDIEDQDVMDLPQYDLPCLIEDLDKVLLYRYVPATYFNIRNMETQMIHLSANNMMNDVFEGLPEVERDVPYQQFRYLYDLAYMCCMTEDNDNLLMWSHYADSHRGFCIEYDLKRLQDDPYKILSHIFPVVYGDKRLPKRSAHNLLESCKLLKNAIEENSSYDGLDSMDNILPLVLYKSNEWGYEKEWRIVYTKMQMYEENDEELYRGTIPFRCISGVYLGCYIDPEIKKNIMEICERISTPERKVKVYQAKLSPDRYQLEFDEL